MKNKIPDFAYHMTKFFTEYLPIQRNLSPNSIATYRDTFRLLLLFYDTEKHIKPNLLKALKILCYGSKKKEIVVQVPAIND